MTTKEQQIFERAMQRIAVRPQKADETRIFIRFFETGAAPVAEPVPSPPEPEAVAEAPAEPRPVVEAEEEAPSAESFFARVRRGLAKTRHNFTDGLANLLVGQKAIDDDLLEEIETQLLMADVGVEATTKIIDSLTDKLGRKELNDSGTLYQALQDECRAILTDHEGSDEFQIDTTKKPFVVLVVGVNGVGKTTTIGKLAKRFQRQGHSVMLAAGDTFRAAAVEQLQVWGDRNHIDVVAQQKGADSASVIYDALQSAQSREIDILIADTAGRLHTKSNLMEELSKVKRVMAKLDPSAPHEVMLVVDAGTGQNAINQAREFHQAVGVSGITMTKLDGTAKGGIVFALADKMKLPIRFIGVGEKIDDLRPFQPEEFVRALFAREE